MKTLTEIANFYETDKGTKQKWFLGYTPIYDQIFTPIRNKKIRLLEIGIASGSSLRMWYDYFPNAMIYGYDKKDYRRLRRYNNDRVETFSGDQSDRERLRAFVQSFGQEGFDIVIDDGSHVSVHQQIALGFLFPYLRQEGMYFIEDLGCQQAANTQYLFKNLASIQKIQSEAMLNSEIVYLQQFGQECKFLDFQKRLLMITKGK